MRFLLDTNILIPLEDSKIVLEPSLANFIRLATDHGHKLLYHPASKKDIARDSNEERRKQTLARLSRYQCLENPPPCPRNATITDENEIVDNEILYALEHNAVHALITEDRGIHTKAKALGISKNVYFIQTAEEWLKRLHTEHHVSLPNIHEVYLYQLNLNAPFFDSLKAGYPSFESWFTKVSPTGRKAWVHCDSLDFQGSHAHALEPQALCIYNVENNPTISDSGQILKGRALKLCTFKVGESVRGRKIGELFLKAAFQYATDNNIENIFITARSDMHGHLISLLKDFGFIESGRYKGDDVYVKYHPNKPPQNIDIDPLTYHQRYFPHYRNDAEVKKFIVPIMPHYHQILFPDSFSSPQLELFNSNVGNAIKLAYLCHSQLAKIKPGDIIMFYRSRDSKAITSLGIVEEFRILNDAEEIAKLVSRRTVYSMEEIQTMAKKPTKVILFRLAKHFSAPISYDWLKDNRIVNGNIQTIREITNADFGRIFEYING